MPLRRHCDALLQDISYQSQSQSQGQGQSQGQSRNSGDLVGTKHLVAEFHSPKVLKIAKGMLQRAGSDNTKVWVGDMG